MYEIFEKLLQDHGITAYKLSKDTGVSTATLSEWKSGKYTPKADKLKAIADYFGVSLDYLTGRSKNKEKQDPGTGLSKSSEFIVKTAPGQPFQQLDELPEDVQKQIIDFYNYHVERHLKEKDKNK